MGLRRGSRGCAGVVSACLWHTACSHVFAHIPGFEDDTAHHEHDPYRYSQANQPVQQRCIPVHYPITDVACGCAWTADHTRMSAMPSPM